MLVAPSSQTHSELTGMAKRGRVRGHYNCSLQITGKGWGTGYGKNFEVSLEMSDPLSFFAGEDSSDSESEETPEPEQTESKGEEDSRPDKLPSPDTLFATVGRPSFLSTTLHPSEGQINWDRFVKNDTDENVHSDGTHAAIAPPSDLESSRGNISSSLSIAIASTYSTPSHEISAAPVKYSQRPVDDEDDSGVTEEQVRTERAAVSGDKRALATAEESDGSSSRKKAKAATFRQKEKRKRDTGQTSRGKSYVEEEKRILRQTFATDEVMT